MERRSWPPEMGDHKPALHFKRVAETLPEEAEGHELTNSQLTAGTWGSSVGNVSVLDVLASG